MGQFKDNIVANLPRLPPKQERKTSTNPIALFRSLTALQWAFFLSGWLAWLCDAIDFFAVSLTVVRLAKTFHNEAKEITTSITLTLLFRPLGAIIFGLMSDRYGRKWPLIANILVCAVLSLGTGFVRTFSEFLAVRSLFGIAMGGIWGQAASLGLENLPVEARGLFSGIMQQGTLINTCVAARRHCARNLTSCRPFDFSADFGTGYAVGLVGVLYDRDSTREVLLTSESYSVLSYLIAAVLNLYVVPHYNNWRVLFYVAAGISAGAAVLRALVPESTYFVERKNAERASGHIMSSAQKSKIFVSEIGHAFKTDWGRLVVGVLLMSGFNFFSHGSQDLYPTYLQKGKGLSAHASTVATIIGNCGAIVGGTIAGAVSQRLGRRITIILCCLWTICWIPLWLLPNKFGPLAAGAFFVQSGVQGAWGVIPIYLTEISPVAFRATAPSLMYQLGNMVSSASAQIESTAGAKIKTKSGLPDYGKVSAILIGVVAAWIIVCCIFGSEDHSAHFENAKAAFEPRGPTEVEGKDARSSPSLEGEGEKDDVEYKEHV
ncbi:BQ2448_4705 [Microbotryum intermedium]|uniref:BQ2448_4705 protein n=1 Tax=Microbotryum intermedium TaxID=269621 RepID=A0A238FIN3_9BASI|nr:BQ2448_4705 [Microbotryum intermedium]